MAALFAAASTQYLVNASPSIVDYPFSIGAWVNLSAVGSVARTLFALSDTGTANNYLLLRMTASEAPSIVAAAGGADDVAGGAVMVAGTWHFLLARFASSISRRLAHLQSTGQITNAAGTPAAAPTGMDTMTLGALSTSAGITEPWDGLIGEFWLADGDVYPPGGTASAAFVRQLAHGGPFSISHVAKDIIEYRSLRKYPSSEGDEIGQVFHGAKGPQTWVNNNGVAIGHHPPLPYWYAKPPGTKVLSPWQELLRIQNWGEAAPWPPPSDFSQPEMYVTRGTQRF